VSASFAFRGVSAIRRDAVLFEGLSFTLTDGAALLVTGPNGAGKSTLIRVAAGLLPPAMGSVARDTSLALLSEAAALDSDLTLGRALHFWASLDGTDALVADAMATLDLAALAEVPVRMLSTGQRRRAAMARVIASGASLWLLDEPANGLDTAAVARLEAAIARHRAAGGMAIVATHLPIALPAAQAITLGGVA
jgi:heme exporter protein A